MHRASISFLIFYRVVLANAEVEKTAQQLYAMINYGEIWKRFNFKNDLKLDSKLKNHLNDMICKG